MKRYNVYSEHLQEKFGKRVYKLPINLPGTCPNRDGSVGTGGCIFCDEEGAGFQCLPNTVSIANQIEKNKNFFKKRFSAEKFIAYFQSFTNTYIGLEQFKSNILEVVKDPEIVGLSISTRPDCINDAYLDFLAKLQDTRDLNINIELGLQTVNYHTLKFVNRGHTLAEFIDAQLRIKKRRFESVAHIILNLPGDDMVDVIENAKIVSALEIDYVKLHSLYIVKGTKLGDLYEQGLIDLISLDEYVERVIVFLEYLDPRIIIQRLVGKGPRGNLYFCNWSTSWWKIKEQIEWVLEERDTYQGKKFNYLNGGALKRKNLI
ncbi:MAG: TIGR01212 family radical SAM protein [Clostridia bacterium]|nr:TIGR01212 family radical SAM protein [Clostridia bacterium]